MPNTTSRDNGLVMPTLDETFMVNNPQHKAAAVSRLARYGLEGSPQERTTGKAWYGLGHDVVESQRGDLSFRTAAGIAAALSPGQDWEKQNIPAIGESQALDEGDWEMVRKGYEGGLDEHRARRARGEQGVPSLPSRQPEIAAMLREKAPHLAGASDPMLLKTHAMLQGQDPEEAMTRHANPKTHAFFHGLMDPRHQGGDLAIDYRMSDMVANQMRSTTAYRALGKGYYKNPPFRGEMQTNYQHHEDIVGQAGQVMAAKGGRSFAAFRQPLAAQAYLWVAGKNYEQRHPDRQMSVQNPGEVFTGPTRTGQPYMSRSGGRL